ncbi:MAG TPA: lysozyme [Terracidiphilus sp.]|nr:lysozyme [Terracidiphilus sp.]
MRLSPSGFELVMQFEGFRPATYLDSAGLPTIGYGHKLLPGESHPDGVTQDQARDLLARDAAAAAEAVARFVRAPLTQGQFDALVDFVYNLGAARLASSTLLRELNDGNLGAAALQFLKWDHCGGAVISGLKARREAEMRLFLASDPATSPLPMDSPHLVPVKLPPARALQPRGTSVSSSRSSAFK